jgi:hypothetical protein
MPYTPEEDVAITLVILSLLAFGAVVLFSAAVTWMIIYRY